jgi:hypothetical protein
MSDQIKEKNTLQLVQEKASDVINKTNIIKADKVCVIITQKKNSSWIDDLDAREKLNKCQRVFH